MDLDRPHNQRRGDTLQNKILKLAGLIAALGIILAAVIKTGSLQFMTRDESAACHARLEARDDRLQEQITASDKTQAVMIEKMDGLKTLLERVDRKVSP